jgi:hypothetical protein
MLLNNGVNPEGINEIIKRTKRIYWNKKIDWPIKCEIKRLFFANNFEHSKFIISSKRGFVGTYGMNNVP